MKNEERNIKDRRTGRIYKNISTAAMDTTFKISEIRLHLNKYIFPWMYTKEEVNLKEEGYIQIEGIKKEYKNIGDIIEEKLGKKDKKEYDRLRSALCNYPKDEEGYIKYQLLNKKNIKLRYISNKELVDKRERLKMDIKKEIKLNNNDAIKNELKKEVKKEVKKESKKGIEFKKEIERVINALKKVKQESEYELLLAKLKEELRNIPELTEREKVIVKNYL